MASRGSSHADTSWDSGWSSDAGVSVKVPGTWVLMLRSSAVVDLMIAESTHWPFARKSGSSILRATALLTSRLAGAAGATLRIESMGAMGATYLIVALLRIDSKSYPQ
jgi:hypothetical protein